MFDTSCETALEELGPAALAQRDKVEEVKARIGVQHGHFDAWIYGFLENKNFHIDETIAKLKRRFDMEVNELSTYELTEYQRESMRSGVVQDIGNDKRGRTILYINVKRDFPQAKFREERQQLFDIYVSYATRLRQDSKHCQMILLVDHEGVSVLQNIDMYTSSAMALRISKFYPGSIEKIYLCNMSGALTAVLKPIVKRLPDIVSKRLEIVTSKDIEMRSLCDLIDDTILPDCLGGRNKLHERDSWMRFAENLESYYEDLKRAVNERGLTVKEWELERIGIKLHRRSLFTAHSGNELGRVQKENANGKADR